MSPWILVILTVFVGVLAWAWTILARESWPRTRRRCGACGTMMYYAERPLICATCGADFRMVGLVSDALWQLVRPRAIVRRIIMWTGVVVLGAVCLQRLIVEPAHLRTVEWRERIIARTGQWGPQVEAMWVTRAWAWPWEGRETHGIAASIVLTVRDNRLLTTDASVVTIRIEPGTWRYQRIGGLAESGDLSDAAITRWMAQAWGQSGAASRPAYAEDIHRLVTSGTSFNMTALNAQPIQKMAAVEIPSAWPWALAHGWWIMGGVWLAGGVLILREDRRRSGGTK